MTASLNGFSVLQQRLQGAGKKKWQRKKFDGSSKTVLDYKASLITASKTKK